MDEVWRQGETTIRRVWEVLRARRPLAFNTVMTVMNRLASKGLLVRRGPPRRYRFRARHSREAFLSRISRQLAEGYVRDFGTYAVAHFVDALRDLDPARLEELRKAVAAARRRADTEPHTG